ncbi:hypothetical protein [Anabaena azotica]|uniref:Uncharacterized protein n=1 Tax=Anabaena azotica FACHB-119 TaxID=947527 RepID=A0ABR8D7K9_9NOST|nr:hypothetical protein [Anabaena azotica]MBD2503163.1 hypothetical protein [Anabaena azotica FACHB-119]
MPTNQELEAQARQQAREVLSKQPNFSQLDRDQQFEQYKSLVTTIYNQLLEQERAKEIQSLDGQLIAQQSVSEAMAAGDMINDNRHLNRRIDEQGQIAGNVLRQVNFPQFVKDLLKSVFDANLQVTQDQINSYVKLVEELNKPISDLIKNINDESAKLFLAEKFSDKYQLLGNRRRRSRGGEAGNSEQNSNEMQLVAKDGSKLDKAELEGAIAQAKLDIARQNQRLLEEMLLMGVNRMVVENGKIKASVDFKITATEDINRYDEAGENDQKSQSRTDNVGGGVSFLSMFGVKLNAGTQTTNTHTNIAISTADTNSTSTTESSTTVKGSVEINFKSDYFKLDNFKEILQPSGQRNQGQRSPGGSSTDGQAPQAAEAAS